MRRMISLYFDDGNEVQYTNFFPILEKYALRATFYIVTSEIGAPGKMNTDQIKDLYKRGHEIGSHTHTHPYLTRLSDQELDFEFKKSLDMLKGFRVKTLSYPYKEYDTRIIHFAKRYYEGAVGSIDYECGNMGAKLERYFLKTIPTEYAPPEKVPLMKLPFPTFKRSIKAKVEADISNTAWTIFGIHGPSSKKFRRKLWAITHAERRGMLLRIVDPSLIRSSFGVNKRFNNGHLRKFEWLVEYLASSPVETLSISQALNRYPKGYDSLKVTAAITKEYEAW